MNVLFLTTHLNRGGITSYLTTLCKGLKGRNVGVHIGSAGGDTNGEFLSCGTQVLELNIRTKSELDPRIYLALFILRKYVREQKIDLIHSQTRITQVIGTLLSNLTGCPHVTTCHGFFKTRLSRRLFPCWGDTVIAISPAVKEHLHNDFKVPEENIALVPSGVDTAIYAPVGIEQKRRMRLCYNLKEEPVIGIIARLSDVKGHDILIKALDIVRRQMPGVKLLIAGEGKTEAVLKSLVRTLNLETTVFFYPLNHNPSEVLAVLDLFVMPSRQEGLGLSIMEAQAMGVAVVASRVGGIPSLIEDGRTGFLVEPEDPEALAKVILGALSNPDRLRKIEGTALEFVRNNYSVATMVEKTLQVYTKAIR